MTNYYVRTKFVPERNKNKLVENKIYKLMHHDISLNFGNIISEIGNEIVLCLPFSAYLDNKSWELLEEISRSDLITLLSQTKNSIFSVKFIKKDGTERKLTGRFGVKKHLKHEDRKPTVNTDKFFVIYDMVKKDYRAVNKETIFEAKIKGKNYIIKEGIK